MAVTKYTIKTSAYYVIQVKYVSEMFSASYVSDRSSILLLRSKLCAVFVCEQCDCFVTLPIICKDAEDNVISHPDLNLEIWKDFL